MMRYKLSAIAVLAICIILFSGIGKAVTLPFLEKEKVDHFTAAAKQEKEKNLSEKDALQEKMLNSIHFFNTAEGKFDYSSNDIGFHYHVDYRLDMTKADARYAISVTDGNLKEETIYSGGQLLDVFPDKKEYRKAAVENAKTKGEFKKLKDTVKKTANGTNEYYYPETSIQLGLAGTSLHSKEIAIGFLEDHSLWEIRGKEKTLNRQSVVVEGHFSVFYQDKLHASTFKLWIDEKTGILLNYETYDAKSHVVDALHTTEITIDKPISLISADAPPTFKKIENGQ